MRHSEVATKSLLPVALATLARSSEELEGLARCLRTLQAAADQPADEPRTTERKRRRRERSSRSAKEPFRRAMILRQAHLLASFDSGAAKPSSLAV